MELLYGILIGLEVLVSIVMIIAILLQPSDGGLGTAFGGGGSQALFGGRGATHFLSKLTGVLAGVFFVLSISIALITSTQKSVVDSVAKAPASRLR
jgi:preprotein translocase subunit SecG